MISLPLPADDKKEADRLDNCGTVLKEILDIPTTFHRPARQSRVRHRNPLGHQDRYRN